MSLLFAIIIGVGVGVAAAFLLSENLDHIMLNILVGLSGGIFGLVIYALFLNNQDTPPFIDVPSLLTSAVSAAIFVMGFNGLHKIAPKRAAVDSKETDPKEAEKEEKSDAKND